MTKFANISPIYRRSILSYFLHSVIRPWRTEPFFGARRSFDSSTSSFSPSGRKQCLVRRFLSLGSLTERSRVKISWESWDRSPRENDSRKKEVKKEAFLRRSSLVLITFDSILLADRTRSDDNFVRFSTGQRFQLEKFLQTFEHPSQSWKSPFTSEFYGSREICVSSCRDVCL